MLPFPIAARSEEELAKFTSSFRSATPVRHVVIDGFLDDAVAHAILDTFPAPTAMPKSRDYMFSDKRELSTLDRHSSASRQVHDALVSPELSSFLSSFGKKVFVDPEYLGGGFHAGLAGSFLDLHTDFNLHPAHADWLRELNILIYLNPNWEPSWDGRLILTDDPAREGVSVEPLFNRAVIMESTALSFHGYRRANFPEGTARRSIAAYAYSRVEEGAVKRRTTTWAPQDAHLVKKLLAKNWNRIVLTKNRFFGSATRKNRR